MTSIALLEAPSHAGGDETPGSRYSPANLNIMALKFLALPFLAVHFTCAVQGAVLQRVRIPSGNCRSSR